MEAGELSVLLMGSTGLALAEWRRCSVELADPAGGLRSFVSTADLGDLLQKSWLLHAFSTLLA